MDAGIGVQQGPRARLEPYPSIDPGPVWALRGLDVLMADSRLGISKN